MLENQPKKIALELELRYGKGKKKEYTLVFDLDCTLNKRFLIGRSRKADIKLPDNCMISKKHGEIGLIKDKEDFSFKYYQVSEKKESIFESHNSKIRDDPIEIGSPRVIEKDDQILLYQRNPITTLIEYDIYIVVKGFHYIY
jgi:hypothetical protein